jgi:enamine deaminase RidA (YjgF/YER057c/UK114 family)
VKLTIFVTDVAYLPAIRAARDEFVDTERPPASTAVQVAALFRPELLLEVEAWALV